MCNLYNKKNYVIHIKALEKTLDHGLRLKKHRVIELNQETWLKSYTDTDMELYTNVKNDVKKDFFKLVNHSVFGKTTKIVRKHRNIKLMTTDKRRKYTVSQQSYHKTK